MPPLGDRTPEASGDELVVVPEPGERWRPGAVADGRHMPFGTRPYARDLARSAGMPGDEPNGGSDQSRPWPLSGRGPAGVVRAAFALSGGAFA
ncbi:hypothetical protein ADK57_33690 [Streptomyces sp. MMG1533]|uniref:hypothetical protein n=1 Tax=Streptomyces sp. MMG1533 TaxID=1415546 RepID=UPI0006AD905C|nr:hypothetical protein [Streptomyces sp. MMG1533]KOU59320.1 hypothetical protein ADK57_33690 [Streptomyces sp. MMG1533]